MECEPPIKKIRNIFDENNHVITIYDIFDEYKDFFNKSKSEFKIKIDAKLKNENDKLTNSIKNQKSNSEQLLIAFFGAPGTRKSSTINFLISGDKCSPLPTSDESCKSSTKTPIRCKFIEKDEFCVKIENSNGDIVNKHTTRSLVELNKKLENLMNDNECEEIILEISNKVLPHQQASFLKNVEFLDLIGLPIAENKDDFNESIALRKNRYSINKQQVDAVFLFGNRQQLVPDMVKYMWLIDIFNVASNRIPKLVMIRKEEFIENCEYNGWLKAFQDGTCKKQIEHTLCLALDFSLKNEVFNDEDEKLLKTLPELFIKNKEKIVPKLCERSDAICLITDKNQLMNDSKQQLQSILNDIKKYKLNYLTVENSRNITDILSECRIKLMNKLRSSRNKLSNDKNKLHERVRNYLYTNKSSYAKIMQQTKNKISDIIESIPNDDFQADIICVKLENVAQIVYQTNLYRSAVVAYERILYNCSLFYFENVKIIKDYIFKLNLNNKDIYSTIDLDLNEDYFYKNLLSLDNAYKTKFVEFFMASALNYEDTIVYEKFEDFSSSLTPILHNLVDDIRKIILKETFENAEHIDEIYQFALDIKKFCCDWTKFCNINEDFDNQNDEISEALSPELFTSSHSLKFPLEIGNFSLKFCQDEKWILKDKKKTNEALFIDGFVKSQMSLTARPITNKLIRDLNQYKIDCAIQIHIDRDNKKIEAEYDADILRKRLDTLFKHILESTPTCTALYPIFISSKPRGINNPGVDFKPNLILPSLHQADGPTDNRRFMIFLMFEAGTCETRYKFSKNIEYYLNEVKTSVASENDFNPIIPVFLPERQFGIGRKRKIMLLLAEHLNLTRFYLIDDDIDEFFQYDERTKILRTNKYTTLKALDYMSRVLDYSIDCNFDADLDMSKIKENLFDLLRPHFGKLQCINSELMQLIYSDNLFKNLKTREYFIRLILTHLGSNPADAEEVCKQIKDILNVKSKSIGQIALTSQRHFSKFDSLLQRLQGNRKTTHYISSVRYQVVLYNLDAIKGIHPVTDRVFFEIPLSNEERVNLCRKVKKTTLHNVDAENAARLGYKYSDKAHIFYQIKNGVSGYGIYYFSFKVKTGQIPSKVDADETNSQLDELSNPNSIQNLDFDS